MKIRADHREKTEDCKTEMLVTWLRQTREASWSTVVRALVGMRMGALAQKIAMKYGQRHACVIFMYELVLGETQQCKECCMNDWTNLNLLALQRTDVLYNNTLDRALSRLLPAIAGISMCDFNGIIDHVQWTSHSMKFHLIVLSHVQEWQSRLQWRERSYCNSLL